jgi:hypothetical protein
MHFFKNETLGAVGFASFQFFPVTKFKQKNEKWVVL